MPAFRSFLKYWLPVVLWMMLIFTGSGDTHSGQRSSRLIAPIVRFFVPDISPEKLDAIVFQVRKMAHLTEYFGLALLVWRARRQPRPDDFPVWRWPDARFTLLICILYAASDEWHQLYVPHREAAIRDVVVDALGAVLGLGFIGFVSRFQRKG